MPASRTANAARHRLAVSLMRCPLPTAATRRSTACARSPRSRCCSRTSSIYSGLVAAGGDGGALRAAARGRRGDLLRDLRASCSTGRSCSRGSTARDLPRVGRYARRRALRIVPAYWLALTVAAVVLTLPGVLSASGIVDLLRLRPDLLDGHAHRRARAGLDAVRRGHVLRLPAAVGVGHAAARRRRACAARRSRSSALAAFSLAWKAAFVWSGRPIRSSCRRGCTRCPPTSTSSRSAWGWRCSSRGGRCPAPWCRRRGSRPRSRSGS